MLEQGHRGMLYERQRHRQSLYAEKPEKPINLSRQLYLLVISHIGADRVKSLKEMLGV
jgi:ABC-type Fe2+-enterobactin transport system substrate-binding protein